METPPSVSSKTHATPAGFYSKGYKRMKLSNNFKQKVSTNVIDYSDPFAVLNMMEKLHAGKYGSATKDMKVLIDWKVRTLAPLLPKNMLSRLFEDAEKNMNEEAPNSAHQQPCDIIDLEDDSVATQAPKKPSPIVILSDDEDDVEKTPSYSFKGINLPSPFASQLTMKDMVVHGHSPSTIRMEEKVCLVPESDIKKDMGVYVGVEDDEEDEDDESETKDDGLGDIWQEMSMALECSKDVAADKSSDSDEDVEDCDHSFVLKDDIGYVCRVCGVIDRGIETIIDVQFSKVKCVLDCRLRCNISHMLSEPQQLVEYIPDLSEDST